MADDDLAVVTRLFTSCCPDADADPDTPVAELGMSSLAATRFVLAAEHDLGLEVTLDTLASGATLRQIAGRNPAPEPDRSRRHPPTGVAPVARPSVDVAQQSGSTSFCLPLLPLQQAYVVSSAGGPGSDPVGSHIYREWEVEADLGSARRAWNAVVDAHPVLSMWVGEDGQLHFDPSRRVEPDVVEVDAESHHSTVTAHRGDLAGRLDRSGEPVVARLVASPGLVTLQLSVDAVLTDGHGLLLAIDQWRRLVDDPTAAVESDGNVEACVEALAGRTRSPADVDYWKDYLGGARPGPFAGRRQPVEGGRRPLQARVEALQWEALVEWATATGVTPTALVWAVFSEVILDAAGVDEATFVLTTSERTWLRSLADGVVGPFTSSLLARAHRRPAEPLSSRVRRMHVELWEHLSHTSLPGVEAIRRTWPRGRAVELPVVFTSLLGVETAEAGGFALRPTYQTSQTSGVAIEHQMWELDGGLVIHWDICDELLPPFVAEQAMARVVGLLNGFGSARVAGPPPADLQQSYLVQRLLADGDAEPCQATFEFDVSAHPTADITAAWADLVRRHDSLRTVVGLDGEVEIIDPEVAPSLSLVEAPPTMSWSGAKSELLAGRAELRFPLGRWPMHGLTVLEGAGQRRVVIVTLDLITQDGRSIHQLVRELVWRIAGQAPPSLPSSPSLGDARRGTPDAEAAACYWEQKFAALPPGPVLGPDPLSAAGSSSAAPAVEPDVSGRAPAWSRRTRRLPGFGRFQAACARHQLWPDAVLAAALGMAWAPEVGQPFTVSFVGWDLTDDADRPAEASCFAWLADPGDTSTLAERAHLVAETITADFSNGQTRGMRALRSSRARAGAGDKAVSGLTYTGLVDWGKPGLPPSVPGPTWSTRTPGVSLDMVSLVVDDDLEVHWDAAEAELSDQVLERTLSRFEQIMRRVMARDEPLDRARTTGEPQAEVVPAVALSEHERHMVLYQWNDTARPFAADGGIHRLFERVAAGSPDKTALIWRHGSMTFGQLDRRANRIAHWLAGRGIGSGDRVAIATSRGPDMVAAVFGVLKAGGTYVPIEPSQAPLRASRMLQRVACRLALTTSDTTCWDAPDGVELVAIDRHPEIVDGPTNALDRPDEPDALAYVIFTSGSTGEPKGVGVPHRALHNLVAWSERTHGFGPHDIGLCVTSLGFDLSAFDVLGLLGLGGSLYVADDNERRDPGLLADVVEQRGITFWNSAPTALDHLRPYIGGWAGGDTARNLRLIYLSGDYTPIALAEDLLEKLPETRLVSLGGATEATVWSNWHDVTAIDPAWVSIPYGRPIDNARYYILDDRRQPVGVGVEGDLYISGAVVSSGYVGDKERTAERFVPDPFSDDGSIMYDTGDRAVFFEDGTIGFRGRVDQQVKLRGHRVELGEIEHILRQRADIDDAIVLVRTSASGDQRLVAYLATTTVPAPVARWREHAQAHLPGYMVPNYFHALDRFPATVNGKLDREALPWPLPEQIFTTEEPAPAPDHGHPDRPPVDTAVPSAAVPASAREAMVELLVARFEPLLESRPDPAIDVWDQGATSFTMVQVSNAIMNDHGVRVPIEVLVERPTIEAMAEVLVELIDPADLPPADLVTGRPTPIPPAPETAPAPLAVFDPEAKAALLAERALGLGQIEGPRLRLPAADLALEPFRPRRSIRTFGDGPIPLADLAHLLAVMRSHPIEGERRHLYPSAGDLYALDLSLYAKQGSVEGLAGGVYRFDPARSELVLVGPVDALDRNCQFLHNRELFDGASVALFVTGHLDIVERVYGHYARDFLLLEAGYLGYALQLAQDTSRIGLCPIGSFNADGIAPALSLDEGHILLHSFLGGRLAPGPAEPLPQPTTRHRVGVAGYAGRFPGATTPDELWDLLSQGRTAIGPAPDRVGPHGGSDLIGGFLDDVESFDPLLFKVAPVDAAGVDPQARILLEVVWECLERSGTTPERLEADTNRTGVFVGHLWNDYRLVGGDNMAGEPVTAAGSELANRISHAFGLTGPSIAVDTACSSSLAALHLAVAALERGECEAAVVCGVNIVAHPNHVRVVRDLGLLASSRSKGAFDATCGGWHLGEGAGAILLRRFADDHQSDDPSSPGQILAVIESTSTGFSGAGTRFGAPSPQAIEEAMAETMRRAAVDPRDIDYIECATSGAVLADAAELEAIDNLFGSGRGGREGVVIGTVKPNIGHLEAASGMSQLIKVLLQFEHGETAPTLVAAEGERIVELDDRSIRTASAGPAPRRVMIGSVGATGSTAHTILARRAPVSPLRLSSSQSDGAPYLLISAASEDKLDQLVGLYLAALETAERAQEAAEQAQWASIRWTTQCGRTPLRVRLAVEATAVGEAIEQLRSHQAGRATASVHRRVSDHGPTDDSRADTAAGPAGDLQRWLRGGEVDWSRWWTDPPPAAVLPTYPFDRQRFWLPPGPAPAAHVAAPAARAEVVTVDAWLDRLVRAFARAAGIDVDQLDPSVPLEAYGLSSRVASSAAASFNQDWGSEVLRSADLYQHRDLASLASHLAGRSTTGPPSTDPGVPAVAQPPVAIIGMAGRFPGSGDLDELWDRLVVGADLVGPPPARRTGPEWPDGVRGGFLDDVAGFDTALFGVTPADASRMDPQERLFLEVTREALDDAGYPRTRLAADHAGAVGVYAGVMQHDYPFVGLEHSNPERWVDAGSSPAGVANRVSYHFDLVGPSMTVDTMCSSSLTTVHLAVEALRAGRCRMAVVGGVNLSLHPNKYHQQQRMGMTSPNGRCLSFSADGDGFVPGEGAGCVVLKPLADARRDGDRVRAVILGTAINHGGKVNGFTVPSSASQAALLKAAVDDAGVDPSTISFVETHGTGTRIGDPIEADAVVEALRPEGGDPVAIGAIKANIGHLEAAAGVAGLLKTVLQMEHRQLVPLAAAGRPNPDVDWTRLRSPDRAQSWQPVNDQRGEARWRAGVSSFGAGGSNAHVIVEAAPPDVDDTLDHHPPDQADGRHGAGQHAIVLSAASERALKAMAAALAADLAAHRGRALADVAYTLQIGRDPLARRWGAIVGSIDEAIAALRDMTDSPEGAPRTGIGPGGGPAQRPGGVEAAAFSDLEEMVGRWCAGGSVDWRALHRGPRRIVSLPGYAYQRRRCWVDTIPGLELQLDVRPGREPLVTRTWVPVPEPMTEAGHDPSPASSSPRRPITVVGEGPTAPLAQRLAAALGASSQARPGTGDEVVVLLAGLAVERASWLDELDRIRRMVDGEGDPDASGGQLHLILLVAGLLEPSSAPADDRAAALAGALYGLAADQPEVELTVVDIGSGPWLGADVGQASDEDTAGLAADIDTIADRRLNGDICLDVSSPGRDGDTRGGPRMMEAAWASATPPTATSADVGQLVLVTGGSKGIGLELVDALLSKGHRKLVTVSRGPSPELDSLIARHRASAVSRPGRAPEIETIHCSVSDGPAMAAALASVEARLGPIERVIHAAGVGSAADCLVDEPLDRIAGVFEPKVDGLDAVVRALDPTRLRSVVCLSSVSAAVAELAASVADYAAANRAMEYAAGTLRRRGVPVTTVALPVWRSSTASNTARLASARMGIGEIAGQEGETMILGALSGAIDGWLVAGGTRGGEAASESSPSVGVGQEPSWSWLARLVAAQTGLSATEVDPRADLADLGVESMMLAQLVDDIEAQLGQAVEPTLVIDNRTIEALAAALPAPPAEPAPATRPNPATGGVAARPSVRPGGPSTEPIAVIGAAARVPGAATIDELWTNLVTGVDAIGEVPPDRWPVDEFFDPAGGPGTSVSRWGGFVDDLALFDPDHFGLDEDEALRLDPAIRLFLEQTENCVRDAGYDPSELRGRPVGLFAGSRLGRYGQRFDVGGAGRGADQNFIAALAAHVYDFTGPNMVIDSACSSSLVAVHLACRSLIEGDCELAVAGGVDILLDESTYLQFTAAGALSPRGRCATFDERADGFVPGEGCGVVLLKPLSAALRDGDRVRAVLLGSATNNDGRTMGMTTPNPTAQTEVVRAALARAGCQPGDLGLIEAHGTATAIGDPIELRALTNVFAEPSPPASPRSAEVPGGGAEVRSCAIGSIKSNVGHLLSAAGIAGLLKVLLAVERGVIPPTLNCERPNPRFDFTRSPFRVVTRAEPWTAPRRIAGVSAFGLGGSNAHVVVGQAASDHTPRRHPLPPPKLERRRLWAERRRPEVTGPSPSVASMLDITFDPEPGYLSSASNGAEHGANNGASS